MSQPRSLDGRSRNKLQLPGSLFILVLGTGVTALGFLNFCDLMFQCGCRAFWNGAAEACNAFKDPPAAHQCPWCSTGWIGSIVPFGLILTVQALAAFLPRRMGILPWLKRLLIALLAFPTLGAITALGFGLMTGYWSQGTARGETPGVHHSPHGSTQEANTRETHTQQTNAAADSALLESAELALKKRSQEGFAQGRELYETVLDLEPDHLEALVGLAETLALQGLYSYAPAAEVMPLAEQAAQSALRLNEESARAWAVLGLSQYLGQWDFDQARESFNRSIELDAAEPRVHHWAAMLLMATGSTEELRSRAVEHIEESIKLAPSSALYHSKRATILLGLGRTTEARKQIEQTLELFPLFSSGHRESALIALEEGNPTRALRDLEKAVELSKSDPKILALLAFAHKQAQQPAEARDVVSQLALDELPSLSRALALLAIDDRDGAFEAIKTAHRERLPGLVYLSTKPGLRSLQADPRWAALTPRGKLIN